MKVVRGLDSRSGVRCEFVMGFSDCLAITEGRRRDIDLYLSFIDLEAYHTCGWELLGERGEAVINRS